MNATVASALIAASVSAIGLVVSALIARWQVGSKADELVHQLNVKTEELTQGQIREVLIKRMEVYPALWAIPQTMLSDWERWGKPVDADWASCLFKSLVEWHTVNGVFLSEQAYRAFGALRERALEVMRRCDQGGIPTIDDLRTMDRIYYAGFEDPETHVWHRGLATALKNDLGSYKLPAVSLHHGVPHQAVIESQSWGSGRARRRFLKGGRG